MFPKNASARVLSELENLFRTLALESRKTNSHLKHATEKAILKLREYKSVNKSIGELKYVLSNDVILRPLILSWSSKNVSISLTALNILQKLLNVNCISSDSFMQILISLRTLLTLYTNYKSQSKYNYLDINIQIKMCQILIQIPASSSWSISRPFLQHIVYITLLLAQSEENAVRSTSLAALQQIATVSLEFSVDLKARDNSNNKPQLKDERSDTEPMYIFECLFHDLCCLSSPQLLYLQHASSDKEKEKEKDKASVNNTSVSFSNLDYNDMNDAKNDNDNESKDSDIVFISSNSHHLVTELKDDNNLSVLRLLDIDFVLDSVPILQLLETLIGNKEFGTALKLSNGLLHILSHQLCPLITKIIDSHDTLSTFEGMMRIARLIIELLSRHYVYLEIETELILSALLRLLELNNSFPDWSPIIILEILRHLLKNSYLLKFFYIKYDMNSSSDKRVFGSLIHALGRFLHQTTINKAKYTTKWSPKRLDHKYFSFIKDAKNINNAQLIANDASLHVSLAVLSLISFSEGLAMVCNVSDSNSSHTTSISSPNTDEYNNNNTNIETLYPPTGNDDDVYIALDVSKDIARHMVEVVWRPLLAALSHMLAHSIEESQYQLLLSIYQTTSRICGRIQLKSPLERLLSSMSEHSLPHPFFNYTFSDILYNLSSNREMFAMNVINGNVNVSEDALSDNNDAQSPPSIQFIQQKDLDNDTDSIKLSIKNVCTIHALVNIAHGLGSTLSSSSWSVLLETFEKLDYIFHRHSIQLVDIDDNIISRDSHWNDEVNMLDSRLQQLFDSSEYLDDESLCELLAALGHLSSSSLAGLATTLDQENDTKIHKSFKKMNTMLCSEDAISIDQVKSFALRKFVQTIQVNIHRLNKIWDHVIAHLHVIMNFKNSTLRHFGINTLIQIQLRVLNESTHNDENEFQKQLLSPYLKLFRSKYSDTRERVIRAVSELLENAGDKISSGWPSIVELLNYVPSTENKVNNNNNSNNAVSVTCLKLAFDDVRLISSDFMECLPDFCLLGLIKTVGLFGKQRLDNNISYSSIGLLWKISDHITLITKEDKEDMKKENNLRSIADGLQIAIFKQLQVLCSDGRSDVRNCAMQTINSALCAYGDRFSLNKWTECIKILSVLLTDVVVKRTRLNRVQDAQKRSQLTKREYRAFKKKWNETEKHCIRGASRICKMFMSKLHKCDFFKIYWNFYLETIIKLLDLNISVASTGIQCLQDIAQSTDFIHCCSQTPQYWSSIIDCYECMIRNIGHKQSELHESESDASSVCDAMMDSVKDLLNPVSASRALFNSSQITGLINNLDLLITKEDKDINNLEILDRQLLRLKKLLAIYHELPPLSPSIAKAVISKIASYLMYLSKCCRLYHEMSSIAHADNSNEVKNKSLFRKTEKTMAFVSSFAMNLLNSFYSHHIPRTLRVECFEIVLNGISAIMDPFLCPIGVVTNAITGFEQVCKCGLPQFSENSSENARDSLRVWAVLGDVIAIAFQLQHHTANQNDNTNQKRLQELCELKLSILFTTMQYILPFAHFAPLSLKKRMVLLLNGHCWISNDSRNTNVRHSRLSEACISAMFELCNDTCRAQNEQKYDVELSAISYQLLIPKIAFILDQYIDDEMSKIHSNRAIPIYRQKHIVHILDNLRRMRIDENLDKMDAYFNKRNKSKNTENKLYCDDDVLLMKGKSNNRPHLFRLYPVLCKLIRVNDPQIKNQLCDVFNALGKEMGLN